MSRYPDEWEGQRTDPPTPPPGEPEIKVSPKFHKHEWFSKLEGRWWCQCGQYWDPDARTWNEAPTSAAQRASWSDFADAGLLWWVNTFLHAFGWAIVFLREGEDGPVVDVYPARVKYRGFSEADTSEGYTKLTKHIAAEHGRMLKDVKG